jgi:large subunit ribosomal protein L44
LMSEFITAYLNLSLPKLPREGIKEIYNYLTSQEILANVSSKLGTTDLILTADFPVPPKTLASSLKAVIGALSESSGDARACEFIRDFVITQLNQQDINEFWKIDEPMELLKELCRDKKLAEPEPRLIADTGRNTLLAAYHVGLYSNKQMIGSGFGEDITIATEEAAKDSLRNLFKTNTNMKPFDYRMPVEIVMKSLSKSTVADKM